MNIWFMLWVFVSVVIVGTFLWSMQVLMRQKTAWREFAKKHNLTYEGKGAMLSGVVRGTLREFSLTVSSDPQVDEDYRGRRYVTTVQVDMKPGMPTEGIVASPALRKFVEGFPLPQEFVPHEDYGWNSKACIRAQDAAALDSYFTRERTQALGSLMSIKGVNVLFIFNEKTALLRFETPDPMEDAQKLDRLVNKILDAAKILSV